MYRFLVTPKWLGFAALMLVLSAVMVGLGFWQLDRYHIRHNFNVRAAHASSATPVPLETVVTLTRPAGGDQQWARVTATGTFDQAKTVVARDRTVNGNDGFEILTPLVLADGSMIMVDRGWVAPGGGGEITAPPVPAPPAGRVTVTGRVHLPESSADSPTVLGGQTTVRRIAPAKIAAALGLSGVYADYLLLDQQKPAAAAGFTRIPADHEPSWLNAGYTVQWWMFALLALVGFGWAARREAHDLRDGVVRTRGGRTGGSRDRLGDDEPPVAALPEDQILV